MERAGYLLNEIWEGRSDNIKKLGGCLVAADWVTIVPMWLYSIVTHQLRNTCLPNIKI